MILIWLKFESASLNRKIKMPITFGTIGNDRLAVPQAPQYDLTRAVSLSAWINDSSLPSTGFMTYFSKNDYYHMQYVPSASRSEFTFHTATTYRTLGDGTIPTLGTWYHLAGTYDASGGSNNMSIYRNAILKDTTTYTDAIATTAIGPSIGSLNAGRWMKGQLADVRVYNRALSASEVQTIYTCKGHDGIVYGLVGRWLLNEDASGKQVTTGSVKDLTIYRNDATPITD
jgi:hypothetical protein